MCIHYYKVKIQVQFYYVQCAPNTIKFILIEINENHFELQQQNKLLFINESSPRTTSDSQIGH